jgi:hypothetical protein
MTIADCGHWLVWRGIAPAAACLWLAACSAFPGPTVSDGRPLTASAGLVYVIRRGWHVDIGFPLADLRPPLNEVAAGLPDTRFVLFGFGDRRYLIHGANMIAALWPGAGVLLVSGMSGNLSGTFGQENVVSVALDATQMSALQTFVLNSLAMLSERIAPLASGPYPQSAYFDSVDRYSGVHTCNTWAAQALQATGLPVSSRGVVFAWQLWHQLRDYPHPSAGPSGARTAHPASRFMSYGTDGTPGTPDIPLTIDSTAVSAGY